MWLCHIYFLAFGQKHKVKTFPWHLFVTMATKSPLYDYYVPVDGGEVLTVRRQVYWDNLGWSVIIIEIVGVWRLHHVFVTSSLTPSNSVSSSVGLVLQVYNAFIKQYTLWMVINQKYYLGKKKYNSILIIISVYNINVTKYIFMSQKAYFMYTIYKMYKKLDSF